MSEKLRTSEVRVRRVALSFQERSDSIIHDKVGEPPWVWLKVPPNTGAL
jgi:hypothetical protein